MALTLRSIRSFIFWISIDCSLKILQTYLIKRMREVIGGQCMGGCKRRQTLQVPGFYNCTCLGSLLKPCRCSVSSQSSEPLKDMHNKQSLKYAFIPGHMVLSGAFLDLWVSSLLKDGLASTYLSEQLSEAYQNECAFAWLFILCGSLKQAQPCSGAEMCWAKSPPRTACGHITKQCPSLSLKNRRVRLIR